LLKSIAEQDLFKTRNIVDLKRQNFIYHPQEYHVWSMNLVWLLGHLKKGNRFDIVSDISEENRYRSSKQDSQEYSAFAREICAILKGGYELVYTGDSLFLTASDYFDQSKIVSTGDLGNGINPSHEETEAIFLLIEAQYLKKTQFKCKLKPDSLELEILPVEVVERKEERDYPNIEPNETLSSSSAASGLFLSAGSHVFMDSSEIHGSTRLSWDSARTELNLKK
jgi:hypothetical protein